MIGGDGGLFWEGPLQLLLRSLDDDSTNSHDSHLSADPIAESGQAPTRVRTTWSPYVGSSLTSPKSLLDRRSGSATSPDSATYPGSTAYPGSAPSAASSRSDPSTVLSFFFNVTIRTTLFHLFSYPCLPLSRVAHIIARRSSLFVLVLRVLYHQVRLSFDDVVSSPLLSSPIPLSPIVRVRASIEFWWLTSFKVFRR